MSLPKALVDLAKDQAFLNAFLKMKPKLPIIDERGTIEYRDGRTGTYALNEDVQIAIQPILQDYGFTLTFETEHPSPLAIRVIGLLAHRKGHTRRTTFEAPADTSGGKSAPQARGSIMSYGHRYCSIDLLNLVTRGLDNDGDVATSRHVISAGMLAAFPNLVSAAPAGMKSLETAWSTLSEPERASVPPSDWITLKEVAQLKDQANE